MWEDFPVHREPRPIVLTSLSAPALDALRSDVRSRLLVDGQTVTESELPAELLSDAIEYCRDIHTGKQQPLARIVRGDGPFGTDRGLMQLPAWMMYPDNRRWPFVALDPEFSRRRTWTPPGLKPSSHAGAVLADDGRTLTFRFLGTPAAYADYPRADVYETETAVCVEPIEVDRYSGRGIRLTYVEDREVVVRLDALFGNRVLIEGHEGSPITVATGHDLEEHARPFHPG